MLEDVVDGLREIKLALAIDFFMGHRHVIKPHVPGITVAQIRLVTAMPPLAHHHPLARSEQAKYHNRIGKAPGHRPQFRVSSPE